MGVVYGFYYGGDPRDFRPDAECCDERELSSHAAACKLWNEMAAKGQTPTPEACQSGWRTAPDGTLYHVLSSPYGIGTYSYPDEWDEPPDDDEDEEPEPWPDAPGQLYLFDRFAEPDEDEPAWSDSYSEAAEMAYA